jgi:hypothetical protein
LVGEPEVKKPIGRCRLRRDENNQRDFQEVECGGMDST